MQLLRENGFRDEVRPGNALVVKVSPFIHTNGDFFYVTAVSTQDKVYLEEDIGLANMIRMTDQNTAKSPGSFPGFLLCFVNSSLLLFLHTSAKKGAHHRILHLLRKIAFVIVLLLA